MHVLLMDDELDRRDRLESGFDDLRPNWRVTCADDARQAAEILKTTACDAIVVANAGSPRLVVDTLTQAKKLRPAALRIAVGETEGMLASLVRAEVAHRVVLAPVSAERLIASFDSTRTLEAMLGSKSLRERISKIDRLPPAPTVALALIRENAAGTANMSAIAQRLHGDAALAAKVLQLSNSAFYSRGKPILEIERALTMLGMDTVINLVLAVQSFINPDLQNRAILASQIAQRVLRDLNKNSLGPVAATASTLAYIGKLLNLRDEAPRAVTSDDDDDGFDAVKLPIESIAGAYLLSLWGLPWPIIEAVAYHKNPIAASEENFGVTTAVHTACALADGSRLDEGWLESLDVMDRVRDWEESARELGCPQRPN